MLRPADTPVRPISRATEHSNAWLFSQVGAVVAPAHRGRARRGGEVKRLTSPRRRVHRRVARAKAACGRGDWGAPRGPSLRRCSLGNLHIACVRNDRIRCAGFKPGEGPLAQIDDSPASQPIAQHAVAPSRCQHPARQAHGPSQVGLVVNGIGDDWGWQAVHAGQRTDRVEFVPTWTRLSPVVTRPIRECRPGTFLEARSQPDQLERGES